MEEKELNIDLRDIWNTIKKNYIIILACALIGALSLFIYNSLFVKTKYEAKSTIIIGKNEDSNSNQKNLSYNDILANQKLITTFSEIAKSKNVINQTIKDLELNYSYAAVASMVNVSTVKDTDILAIKVTSLSSDLSLKIANRLAENTMQNIKDIYKMDNIKIWDKATSSDVSILKPNIAKKTATGIILGSLIGVIFVLGRHFLDKTIRNDEILKSHFDYPIIGQIPDKEDTTKLEGNSYYSNTKIYSEALSMLRTNLSFSSANGEIKTLALTSSQPNEGKSTISVALGRSMAMNGKKVLLVDLDLRNRSVTKRNDSDSSIGIVNYLVKNTPLNQITMRDSKLQNFHMILSGPKPPNPAELLSSVRMKQFIDEAKAYYDFIILDTPPAGILSDARIVSTYADGVAVIVSQNEANLTLLNTTIESLKKVNANIIGFIMSKVRIKDNSEFGYGYGYGYGKHK